MAGSVASTRLGLAWLGLMVVAAASATQFKVGGGRGWSVPDSNAEPYNSWAGRMRFQIGDQLMFMYPKETDAVVVVDQGAYDACNTSSASSGGGRFNDGSTVFTFDRSGPFFFISGNEANCRAGEKLIAVVMADRRGRHTTPPTASPPSSSPAPAATPSLAPSPAALAPSPSTSSSPAPSVSPMAPSPAATPGSAPSLGALAPAPTPTTTTPSSPPAPAAMAPSPSTTPGGVSQPPPGTEGANATTPAAPAANERSGAAASVVAGVVTSLGACIGYTMLAI